MWSVPKSKIGETFLRHILFISFLNLCQKRFLSERSFQSILFASHLVKLDYMLFINTRVCVGASSCTARFKSNTTIRKTKRRICRTQLLQTILNAEWLRNFNGFVSLSSLATSTAATFFSIDCSSCLSFFFLLSCLSKQLPFRQHDQSIDCVRISGAFTWNTIAC